MVDTPARGQGNLSASRSSRGGSKYAPRESVGHREIPPEALMEVEMPGPAQPTDLEEIFCRHERVLT